jgi:predicted XRE-type DNA-binding protein
MKFGDINEASSLTEAANTETIVREINSLINNNSLSYSELARCIFIQSMRTSEMAGKAGDNSAVDKLEAVAEIFRNMIPKIAKLEK